MPHTFTLDTWYICPHTFTLDTWYICLHTFTLDMWYICPHTFTLDMWYICPHTFTQHVIDSWPKAWPWPWIKLPSCQEITYMAFLLLLFLKLCWSQTCATDIRTGKSKCPLHLTPKRWEHTKYSKLPLISRLFHPKNSYLNKPIVL